MKVSAPDRAGAPRFLEAARSSDWIPLWPSHPEPVRFRNNGLLRAVCFLQVGWAWTPPHPCPALMAPPDFLSLPHIDCACGWQCLAPKSFPQGHQVTAPRWVTQQGQPGTRERMHGQVVAQGSWCRRDPVVILWALPKPPKRGGRIHSWRWVVWRTNIPGHLGVGSSGLSFPLPPRWLSHWSPQSQRQQNFLD